MKNVMSVRLDEASLKRIREIARREKKELSGVARDLMADGFLFRLLREVRQGRLSLGGLARRLDVPLAEAMDLLAELGIRSPIEYDDYLRASATAAAFVRDRGE
jgi:hypothetical protein